MIKVCDAIMGSGKTSAAISYINSHPEKRFLYLSPYLDEAARIKESCPSAHFVEPSGKNPRSGFGKVKDTYLLLQSGRNIASTHSAAFYYTGEIIDAIRDKQYTVIIDEAVNIAIKDKDITSADMQMAVDAGFVEEKDESVFCRTDKEYLGTMYASVFRNLESRSLAAGGNGNTWYWLFSDKLLSSAPEVIILTYLFTGSGMEQFLKISGLEYQYVGVRLDNGEYSFAASTEYVPEYVKHLPDMIHICENPKMNAIGKDRTALSQRWYELDEHAEDIEKLKNNIRNYFRNINKDVPADQRMVGTYSRYWGKIRGKGWSSESKNKVVFSQRSSNRWSDHTVLVYPVNIFLEPGLARIYRQLGGELNEECYALSIMIQWIWRSAIRNGQEIYIYIPSKRMRTMLTNWIKSVSGGGAGER